MAFIPVPDVVQAEMVYLCSGQRVQNVLHYTNGATPLPADMLSLAALLVGAWSSDVRPQVSSECSLIEINVTSLDSAIAPAVTYATGLPLAGSAGATILPNNVTLALTKRTILRGRNYRGRLYQVGLGETQVTGNTVNPVTVTALVNAWNEFINIPDTGYNWQMGVVSRYFNNAPRATGEFTDVTTFTTDGIVDSQRRRLPGRGS